MNIANLDTASKLSATKKALENSTAAIIKEQTANTGVSSAINVNSAAIGGVALLPATTASILGLLLQDRESQLGTLTSQVQGL